MEQNPNTYKGIRFTAEATITGINMDREWYYISCHECSKPAITQGDYYACLNHGTQPSPFFRYKFKGYITDTTTTAPLTFFTPAADKVTDHPCSELVEKYKPADPKKIPAEILAAQGKSGIFQFHLNSMGSFTDLTLNDVYDIKKATNSTTDIAQAADEGTASSTSAIITETIEKEEDTDKRKEKSSPQAGTPPSSQLTITERPKNQQEPHSTQPKSAKRIIFNQESTDPKKQKKD
ncbi:DNA helicase [Tanacetum coccineum]